MKRKLAGYWLAIVGFTLLPVAWDLSKMWLLPTFTQVTGPRRYHYYFLEINHAEIVAIVVAGLAVCLISIGLWIAFRGVQPNEE